MVGDFGESESAGLSVVLDLETRRQASKVDLERTILSGKLVVNGRDLGKFPQHIKWSLERFEKREPWDEAVAETTIRGYLAGFAAEWVDWLFSIDDAENVYVPRQIPTADSIRVISSPDLFGKRVSSKETVLSEAVGRRLSQDYRYGREDGGRVDFMWPDNKDYEDEVPEIVDGYASKLIEDKEKERLKKRLEEMARKRAEENPDSPRLEPEALLKAIRAGLFYEDLTMPDAFVAAENDKGKEIIGFTEVKGWKPEEWKLFVAGLEERSRRGEPWGFEVFVSDADLVNAGGKPGLRYRGGGIRLSISLERECEAVDIVRATENLPSRTVGNIALLRVPADADNSVLSKLGKLAEQRGFNLWIQKLPITSKELENLGARMLAQGILLRQKAERSGHGQGLQFSKKEKAVIARIFREEGVPSIFDFPNSPESR